MLGTYPDARLLPWTLPVRPRRARRLAMRSRARQGFVHGVRAGARTACLSAALLCASGVLGAARAPVVLSEPSQPAAAQAAAPSLTATHVPFVTTAGTTR